MTRLVNPLLVSWHNLPLVFLILVVGVLAAALWVWVTLAWWRRLQRRQQMNQQITLVNQSNLSTAFHLLLDLGTLHKKVKANWWLDDQKLSLLPVEKVTYEEETQPQSKSKAAPGSAPQPAAGRPKQGAMTKYRFFRTIATLIANLAAGLASILPGSVNGGLKSLAENIRAGQQSADQAIAKPKALAATSAQIKSNAGQLAKATGSNTKKPAASSTPAGAAQGQSAYSSGAQDTPFQSEGKQYKRTVRIERVLRSNVLSPAERVTYRLCLQPRNPLRKWVGSYILSSQQLENDEIPSYQVLTAQTHTSEFTLQALPGLQIALFFMLSLGTLAVNFLWARVLVTAVLRLWV